MTLQHAYGANGAATLFPFSFAVDAASDVEVLIDAIEQTSGFVVRGAGGNDGGSVLFDAAPANGAIVTLRHRGRVSVSALDSASGHLADKLVAGDGVSLTAQTDADGRQTLTIAASAVDGALQADQNLADLTDKAAARANLEVYSAGEVDTIVATSSDLALKKAANLGDVVDKAAARGNLEVYSAGEVNTIVATSSDLALKKAANLGDVVDKAAARGNLEVYSAGEVNSAVATSSDLALKKAANLGDVVDKAAARGNLEVYSTSEVNTAVATSSDLALKKAANLGDVVDKVAARGNLEVYSTDEVNTAIAASSVQDLKKAENLADLTDKVAARTNLGVYSSAEVDAVVATTSGSWEFVQEITLSGEYVKVFSGGYFANGYDYLFTFDDIVCAQGPASGSSLKISPVHAGGYIYNTDFKVSEFSIPLEVETAPQLRQISNSGYASPLVSLNTSAFAPRAEGWFFFPNPAAATAKVISMEASGWMYFINSQQWLRAHTTQKCIISQAVAWTGFYIFGAEGLGSALLSGSIRVYRRKRAA